MAMDCKALKKLRRFPIRAMPSGPIKMAMNLEIRIPAIILTLIFAVLRLAALTKTSLFM
jgi:hypothetical protein